MLAVSLVIKRSRVVIDTAQSLDKATEAVQRPLSFFCCSCQFAGFSQGLSWVCGKRKGEGVTLILQGHLGELLRDILLYSEAVNKVNLELGGRVNDS